MTERLPDPKFLAEIARLVADQQAATRRLHEQMLGPALAAAASVAQVAQATQLAIAAQQAILLPTKLIAEQVAGAMNAYRAMFADFGPMLERWREQHRIALQVLAPRGWLLSPSFPMGLVDRVMDRYAEGGIIEVEKELLAAMTAENCSELLEETLDQPEFARWAKTLRKAMSAHIDGDYELAIPIWLMAIEGIWRSTLLSQTSPFKGRLSQKERKELIAALSIEGGPQFPTFEALLAVVALMGADVQHENLGGVLKRNGVLHGRFPDVGAEKDSVQLILVLNLLWYLLADKL